MPSITPRLVRYERQTWAPLFREKQEILKREEHTGIKKNEIMPFAATWMDLKIIMLSEVRQTEKDKYHISLICGI